MRRAILAVVGTVAGLVLLLGFKTHTTSASTLGQPSAVAPATGSGSASSSGSSSAAGSDPNAGSTGSSTGSDGSASSSSGSSSGSATGAKTATGQEVQTQFGPVQVKVTVTNGKITSAVATEYPTERPRDVEINSYAVPQLQQETVDANGAGIDIISGATYTSEGYIQSLQSALDQLR